MSSVDLTNFIKALDTVKQDYTCGYCGELCKEPVTLSKCFHLICSSHFSRLKNCPNCNISLEGCTTFSDDRVGTCIDSTKELEKMFCTYKTDLRTSKESTSTVTRKRIKQKSDDKTKQDISHDKKNTLKSKNDLSTKSKSRNVELKSTSDLNTSAISNLSSRINKSAEKRNIKGETLLHLSCRLGKIDKVNELLNQGANMNTKDNAGWTPLHEAVQNGRLDLVKLLLQFNTLINVPGQSNETPLHEAVRYGYKDIVEELVRNGADVNARNCKGETPLQLATGEVKDVLLLASDNIIQTQSVNISHISAIQSELDFDDIRVFCTSEYRTVHNKLKLLSKHHNNLHIEPKFTKKVTHMVVDAEDDGICTSTLEILQGIVSCVWVLTSQWITKSTEDKLEPFDQYEVVGVGTTTYNGPKNARYNKYKQLPGIFDGCHFYLHNFNTKYEISKTIVVTKAILTKLITDAGGIVLRRVPNPELIPETEKLIPYHARKDGKLAICSHYIIFKDIYEPMFNMHHLKALPIGWLIECIEKYELCEPW